MGKQRAGKTVKVLRELCKEISDKAFNLDYGRAYYMYQCKKMIEAKIRELGCEP